MSKKQSSAKLKSILAIIVVAVMLFGTVASLASIAFAAEIPAVEVTTSSAQIASNSKGVVVTRIKEEEVKNPDIVVEGSVGYDGRYCIDAVNPIYIKISNKGTDDYKGKVGVKIFLSQNRIDNTGDYVVYTKSAEIKSGETAEVWFDIHIPTARVYFLVSLMDEAGNVIKSRNIYSEPVSIYNGLNGFISGNEQRDEHLKDIQYTTDNYYYTVNNTVFMDGEVFPDDKMIDAFSSFIMRDYAYVYLDDESRERIDEWVRKGGFLITDSYGKIDDIEEETNGFYVIKSGEGFVYINKGAFKSEKDELQAYSSIPVKRENVHKYEPIDYSNSSTPSLETGKIGLMFIILAVYLVVIGPVLYLVLKKIDRREKAIIIIPALSVLCVLTINLASGGSIYRNGIVNVTTRFELDENGWAKGDTYLSFKTAETGEIAFASEDIDVKPYRVQLSGNIGTDNNGDAFLGMINADEDGTNAVINTDRSWVNSVLRADTHIKLEGSIDADIYMEGRALKGTVTNNTGIDLEEVIFTAFNTGERIESLKDGETEYIEIVLEERGKSNEYYYDGTGIEAIYGMSASRREIVEYYGDSLNNEEAFRLLKRMRHVSSEINYSKSTDLTDKMGGMIIAFSDDEVIEGTFKANGKETVDFYENAFIKPVDIDFLSRSYDIPFGNIYPSDIRSETDSYGNSYGTKYIYSVNQDIFYTYEMPEKESVDEFRIDRSTTYAAKNTVGEEMIHILNVSTGEWELLRYEVYTNTGDYINEENQLKLKVFLTEEGEFTDPRIEVKGGGK
ncbi:MAG: hypothetical protein E7235_02530 [Lachnospiraceae bacterium]|nr:hypothetical protein [Lachnospiraceae bacterium]